MKALKTTLGLFALSLFLFSFAPQQTPTAATENTDTVAEQIQLEDTFQSEELTNEDEKRHGNK